MQKPKPTAGLRHVALFIQNFEACLHFYTAFLGMQIEWQPDADNVYLSSGNDNFAMHRVNEDFKPAAHQRLDHIGFVIAEIDEVDIWHTYLKAHGVPLKTAPRTHRDGARSFYCSDPDENTVQIIYIPSLAAL